MRPITPFGAVVLLWLIGGASTGAADEFFSGAKLLEICTAGEQGSDTGSIFCDAYISGVHDAISDPAKHEICLPADVVLAEMRAAVINFLRDNPELLEFGAAGLVKNALVFKYACTKKL